MSDREVMKLALEALEVATTPLAKDRQEVIAAQKALRQALEQPEQEPYAYIYETNGPFGVHQSLRHEQYNGRYPDKTIPVYTAPPKQEFVCSTGLCHYKQWVGLTDEEEIELDEKYGDDFNAYIDARDTKLKEKNT